MKDAVKMWDIIIFSVSIRNTVKTIRDLIQYIPENKLVMDFTWIKIEATNELKKYTKWEVIATHPMFWPWIKSLSNQNIAYDAIIPWEKWNYLKWLWQEDWANLIELESHKHDELVAILQSSIHFVNLMTGHILKKRWINPKDIIKISTPIARIQFLLLSRFLNQEASLYTDMQLYNTIYKNELIPEMKDFINTFSDIIQNWKEKEFENEFNDIKKFIGQEFLDKALSFTSIVDDELKKTF